MNEEKVQIIREALGRAAAALGGHKESGLGEANIVPASQWDKFPAAVAQELDLDPPNPPADDASRDSFLMSYSDETWVIRGAVTTVDGTEGRRVTLDVSTTR